MPSSPASPRDYFPRGLIQPGGGYRFSADSLLLACFARIKARLRVADLGAGCGVAGFGLVLRAPQTGLQLTAIDRDEAMLAAAAENARRLELAKEFTVVAADVGAIGAGGPGAAGGPLAAGSFGLVVSNPPYREPGRGRASPQGETANAARFDSGAGLAGFIRAASYLLKNGGELCLVGPALRLAEILALLEENALRPKRLLSVHGRIESQAKIVLLEAVKNANPGLRIEAPLILYEKGQGNRVTPEALAFCPYLRCNAG